MNVFENISCPGLFLYNDDSLKNDFNDIKVDYLKRFYFNICPENSNAIGYVTEKIFEAILGGCIPIYWGSFNNPEPQILNYDAIIFGDKDSEGYDAINKVNELLSNKNSYMISCGCHD